MKVRHGGCHIMGEGEHQGQAGQARGGVPQPPIIQHLTQRALGLGAGAIRR